MKRIGILVFGNEYSSRKIPEWKIDASVQIILKKVLGSKFDVTGIDLPAGAFDSVDESGGGWSRDRDAERGEIMRKFAGSKNCKYIMLIEAGVSQYASSNQYIGGLGVLELESVFGNTRLIHAIVVARIFDGKTFKDLEFQRMRGGEPIGGVGGPFQEIDFKAHATMEAVAEDPKTREIAVATIDKSLQEALRLMIAIDDPHLAMRNRIKNDLKKDDWAPF